MSIQSVVTDVTGSLSGHTSTKANASQSLQCRPEPSALLADGRRAEGLVLRASTKQIRLFVAPLAAQFAALDRSAEVGSGPEIFAELFDFLQGGEREQLQKTIRRACNRLELAMLLQNTSNMLSFLDYIWDQELADKLASFTDSAKATAQGWIDGNQPTLFNSELMFGATVVLFQLHRQCGMSREETKRYFEEVRFANSEDLRLKHHALWGWISEYIACRTFWHGKRIPFHKDVQEHIVGLGGDSEVFDRNFRDRFQL